MIRTKELMPGVTLRCCPDHRFKQGCLSFQPVRPMCEAEAALNALIPALLLRGTTRHPDLRSITLHLDDLYGASVGAQVRRIGDYQTAGLICSFIEDRFALPGDRVMEPMASFLEELLMEPRIQNDGFIPEILELEKKNLISAIESERNDKRLYAMGQMLRQMCRGDSFAVPRLGEPEQVAEISPRSALAHYRKILSESPVQLFYVGSAEPERVADLLQPLLDRIDRNYVPLPPQKPFFSAEPEKCWTETMEVSQAKLCLGFTTEITNQSRKFAAAQVFNAVFGGGMTSKLFMNVREKNSLCYSIGAAYSGTKGIVTVSAGIDADRQQQVFDQVMVQLDACCRGEISEAEMTAAKESIQSALRATHDSPGAIEGYYATAALSGMSMTPEQYAAAVSSVTAEDVAEAAASLKLRARYLLRGAGA